MAATLMAQEMAEQPAVLARLIDRFESDVARVRALRPAQLAGVVLVARGSSDHAAVFGRYLVESAAGRPTSLAAPSLHTLYHAHIDYNGYLAIALSQSGATPEIITVCERMRATGARIIAITNNADSPLASVADVVLTLEAGEERAVPATKTVTSQFLAVATVAAGLGSVPFTTTDLAALPGHVSTVLADDTAPRLLAQRWAGMDRLFVVARGLLYGAALETALKIKEATGVLAEGFSAADLRHGPVAAIDANVAALILDGGGAASGDLADLRDVLRRRNGPIALCAASENADLPLPMHVPEALAAILATVRGQQLALALAAVLGRNPDAPAGLSKVTPTH
ncbi:MAG TPA: SIS domain-containing protein [Ktedonobacteraceae bacterium]|nr:SIS domain-containing protein [Ktedonobacteraceae bacterium]